MFIGMVSSSVMQLLQKMQPFNLRLDEKSKEKLNTSILMRFFLWVTV